MAVKVEIKQVPQVVKQLPKPGDKQAMKLGKGKKMLPKKKFIKKK